MFASIKEWLALPTFDGDEEKIYRAQVLNTITLGILLFVVLLIVGNLLGGRTPASTLILDIFMFAIVLQFNRWLHVGKIVPTGLGLAFVGFFYITGINISLGTIRTPSTASYLFWVILTGLVFDLKGILISTFASSLAVLGLILAENAGWLPQPDYTVTITQWITYTVLFGITAILAYSTNQATKRALLQAEAMKRELRKLTLAVEQSPASIVITDLDGNIEYVNPRFTQITGYGSDEVIGKTPRILKTNLTSPETHRLLWETITQGKEWHGELVNHKKDGSLYYEATTISPITDVNRIITHYLAVKEDVSERKRAESALLQSEARFRSLFDQTHDAVFLLDLEGKYLTANQRAVDMFGLSMEELRGDVLSDATKMYEYLERMLAGEEIPVFEIIFQKKDGQILPVEMSMELVRDANGKPMHVQALVRDISSRKQAEYKLKTANEQLQLRVTEVETLQQELREQAIHDPLTGLYNRRYLNESIEREIARAMRENDVFSIIISDIDHFKMINDTYGHQAGDKFLVAIASVQEKYTRGSDIACRFGGEEFLLVLPGVSLNFAMKRAEEIRQMCSQLVIQHEEKDLGVTMSFGVAVYPDHGQIADDIILKADHAMYQSKHAGRNKVTAWGNDVSLEDNPV